MAKILRAFEKWTPGKTALIFNHIPKCAGLTVHGVLKSTYRDRFLAFSGPQDFAVWSELVQEEWALAGHGVWGAHSILPEYLDACYVAFIRDPLRRCVSEYNFLIRRGRLSGSLEHFISNFHTNDYLVRWLGAGSLEAAKECLARTHFFFGLVEYFNDSLDILAHSVPLNLEGYTVRNVSSSEDVDLSEKLVSMFWELNRADQEFYVWAKRLFEERVGNRSAVSKSRTDRIKVELAGHHSEVVSHLKAGRLRDAFDVITKEENMALVEKVDVQAKLLRSIGDFVRAAVVLEEANSHRPHYFDFELAETYLDAGCPEKAKTLMEDLLAYLAPFCGEFGDSMPRKLKLQALTLLGRLYREAGEPDRALACYQSMLNESTKNHAALIDACNGMSGLGQASHALEILNSISLPDCAVMCAERHSLMGHILLDLGDSKSARAEVRKVFSNAPLAWGAVRDASVLMRRMGEFGEAISCLETFISELTQQDIMDLARKELAVTLYMAGRQAEAFAHIDTIKDNSALEFGRLADGPLHCKGSLESVLACKRRVLVIRSAPWILLDAFIRLLEDVFRGVWDIVTNHAEHLSQTAARNARTVYLLPAGKYVHSEHRSNLDPALFSECYDAVVVLMSDLNVGAYGQLLALAEEICPGGVYLYAMPQLYHPAVRSMLLSLDDLRLSGLPERH